MNKTLVFVIAILLFFPLNSYSAQKLSCVELTETANDLDIIADAYSATPVVRENDSFDNMLRDVVDSLHIYARIEDERDLDRYVGRLERAWQKMDDVMFSNALEDVIDSFDRLWKRDCS